MKLRIWEVASSAVNILAKLRMYAFMIYQMNCVWLSLKLFWSQGWVLVCEAHESVFRLGV